MGWGGSGRAGGGNASKQEAVGSLCSHVLGSGVGLPARARAPAQEGLWALALLSVGQFWKSIYSCLSGSFGRAFNNKHVASVAVLYADY